VAWSESVVSGTAPTLPSGELVGVAGWCAALTDRLSGGRRHRPHQ
jgi:hypothetical protein